MNIKAVFSLLAAASLALQLAQLSAAGAKTYQVTGPVLEVTDSNDCSPKRKGSLGSPIVTRIPTVTGDLKVGEKVTITYTMSATEVEAKAGKGGKKEGASPAGAPKEEIIKANEIIGRLAPGDFFL